MKHLASAAFGAAALATAFFASAAPAEARSSFGIYVGGPGYYGGYGYRDRCDDYWYRRRHLRRCGYYDDYDYGYYPGSYYYDDGYYPGVGFTYYGDRHHRRHWRGGDRHRHWDGGRRHNRRHW